MLRKYIILILMSSSGVSFAVEPQANKWSGEAELGYMKTSGNSDTKSLYTKAKAINERAQWRHTFSFEALNKSDQNITTSERYYLTAKSDYSINEYSYLFAMLTYENDRFSGYDNQTTEALGYGYHVFKLDDLKLDLEAGAGARQAKTDAGDTSSEGMIRGAANLVWKISPSATFTENLSVEATNNSTISRSATGLKLQIAGNLAAKLSYLIKNSSTVPAGFEKTDTETVITLVYNF